MKLLQTIQYSLVFVFFFKIVSSQFFHNFYKVQSTFKARVFYYQLGIESKACDCSYCAYFRFVRVYFNLCLCFLFVRVFLFVCAYFSLCVFLFQFVRVYFNLCACISICACVFQFVRAYFNLCVCISICACVFQFVRVFALLGHRSPGPRRAVCPHPSFRR